jgi:hypothetical protein
MDFNTFMKIKRDYSTKGGDTSTMVSLFPYATNGQVSGTRIMTQKEKNAT